MNTEGLDDSEKMLFYLGVVTSYLAKEKPRAELKKVITQQAFIRVKVQELSDTLTLLLRETNN